MRKIWISVAATLLAAIAFVSSPIAGDAPDTTDTSANIALALAVDDLTAPRCGDGRDAGDHCGIAGERLAAGSECPAASGSYCSDEFPYCCGTPGNYYCATDVNSC